LRVLNTSEVFQGARRSTLMDAGAHIQAFEARKTG